MKQFIIMLYFNNAEVRKEINVSAKEKYLT